MGTVITVRSALENDMQTIHEIVDLSFPRFFRYFAWSSLNSEEGRTLVAEAEGAVVGFAKVTEFHLRKAKYGCILSLAVHPDHRRKGATLALVQAGSEDLERSGAEKVFASVQQRNKASLGTFVKAEFVQLGLVGLWRIFSWRLMEFYGYIWYAPGEAVLMHG